MKLVRCFSVPLRNNMYLICRFTRQKTIFECLQAAHAHDFLLAIHIDGLDQHMSPVEYRTIPRYRLMIPLFPIDEM